MSMDGPLVSVDDFSTSVIFSTFSGLEYMEKIAS